MSASVAEDLTIPVRPEASGRLESALRDRRSTGTRLLVPYVTGGLPGWLDSLRAAVAAGADAVEVGIPFSDPVMDGSVIQEASERALAAGATPASVLDELREAEVDVPLAVMTYANIAFRQGWERFASELAEAGVAGAILPDLPLDEVGPWARAADAAGVETVLLAAPTAPDERLPRIVERCRGFVYSVGLLGVTGERTELASSATELAARLKAVTDLPVLIGVGISNAEQAVDATEVADGVVIGTAVVRRMLEEGAEGVAAYLASVRRALDTA
jgi:tryptophan synthase alpha chain